MIFVNLPVRDLKASTAFFTALGGRLNPQFSDEKSSCLVFSDAISVMLLTHEHYSQFNAVNATISEVAAAGGRTDPNPAQDHGFMFGRSVEDPDGNQWEILWMDPAALAQTA